jgi:cyclophilin family peptidyl-prolyl cis-trans isomerase/protein-disulfide isomerase
MSIKEKLPKVMIILLALSLVLSACAPTTAVDDTPSLEENSISIADIPVATGPLASCTAVSAASRDEALANSPFEAVSEADWQRGNADAEVTFIEYGDFQCPFCGALSPTLLELEARYPDDLQVVFRHFPLIGSVEEPIHEKAALAVQASEAAGLQDKFWEMHDLLFARQSEWTELGDAEFTAWLVAAAEEMGIDTTQFLADLTSEELVSLAENAWDEGRELGITGTPYLLINGFPYQGPTDINSLDAIVQLELLRGRQFHECPSFTIDTEADYTATLRTEKGDIVIQLLPKIAPIAVNSFVFLAENDWFDNVTFHRVLEGFMAQGGDPTGSGFGGPGYTFEIEVSPTLLFDRAGLLAMANSGPTSNGSQFFITFGPTEHLNGGFTIFGEVLSGMEVVESLTLRDPSQSPDLPPGDLILDVLIEVN